MADVFNELFTVNVNEHTEKIKDLTYLSWSWAWAETKKRYPNATYTVWRGPDNLPYVFDPKTGYMVYTTVTIEGITHEMWLHVMDASNHAMKDVPYTVKTKYKEYTVEAATMENINKTIMRCLTKNLAMHGLGLYIYNKSDFPEIEEEPTEEAEKEPKAEPKRESKPKASPKKENVPISKQVSKTISSSQRDELLDCIRASFGDKDSRNGAYYFMLEKLGLANIQDMTQEQFPVAKTIIPTYVHKKAE